MSGFSRRVRMAILLRDGRRCVRCNTEATQIHHRRPRGMGGTKRESTDEAANGVVLCGSGTTGCHGWVESNRAQALIEGYLVPQHTEPATVPIHMGKGLAMGWYMLDDLGGRHRQLWV